LVVCGLSDYLIRIIMSGQSNEFLEKVMLTRMLRLARLARAARLMIQFKVLWQLVHGLLGSAYTILWTALLIFVLLYVFAILGMEIIAPDPSAGEAYDEAAHNFYGGLGLAMLTLVQFLTLDSMFNIYRPIVLAKPTIMIYFGLFILLVSVALMNLVTAIIVDAAVQQSHDDREAQKAYINSRKRALLPKLKAMFEDMDADGSGELDLDELRSAPDELKEQLEEISNMEDCEALFNMLDYDNSGGIAIDEFCEGILKADMDKPMELLCLMRQCGDILVTGRKTSSRVDGIEGRLSGVESRLSGIESDLRMLTSTLCPGSTQTVSQPRSMSKSNSLEQELK